MPESFETGCDFYRAEGNACLRQIGPIVYRSGMNLDVEHAALVVIDPQTHFLGSRSNWIDLQNETERRTVQNLARLLKASRRAGIPVAISLTSPRELASEVVPVLQPYVEDRKAIICSPHVVYPQSRVNDVGIRLRQQRIRQVILVGMITSLPIEAHLRDFIELDLEVAIVRDAVAGARLPEGIGYLSALVNFRCIINALWTTDETVQRLS